MTFVGLRKRARRNTKPSVLNNPTSAASISDTHRSSVPTPPSEWPFVAPASLTIATVVLVVLVVAVDVEVSDEVVVARAGSIDVVVVVDVEVDCGAAVLVGTVLGTRTVRRAVVVDDVRRAVVVVVGTVRCPVVVVVVETVVVVGADVVVVVGCLPNINVETSSATNIGPHVTDSSSSMDIPLRAIPARSKRLVNTGCRLGYLDGLRST